jgi:hypothetical protein
MAEMTIRELTEAYKSLLSEVEALESRVSQNEQRTAEVENNTEQNEWRWFRQSFSWFQRGNADLYIQTGDINYHGKNGSPTTTSAPVLGTPTLTLTGDPAYVYMTWPNGDPDSYTFVCRAVKTPTDESDTYVLLFDFELLASGKYRFRRDHRFDINAALPLR